MATAKKTAKSAPKKAAAKTARPAASRRAPSAKAPEPNTVAPEMATAAAVPPGPAPQAPPPGGVPTPNQATAGWQAAPPMRPDQERQYAMFLHLSALAGLIIGFFVAGPLVMWLIKKDESQFIDRHGRTAINFHLSLLVYAFAGGILFVLVTLATLGIGALLLLPFLILGAIALAVLSVVFPIVACLRATAGLEYTYPLSIRFIPPPGPPVGATPTLI